MGARASTFTSFVNIQEAGGVDATLNALERKAKGAFDRIARQAQAANAAANGGRSSAGAQSVQALAAAERQRAQAISATTAAQNAAAAASARVAGRHMIESNAARAAAASTNQLERSLRLAAIAANVAQGPLGPIAGRLGAVAAAVRDLSGVQFGAVGAGALIATFTRAASSAQDLKSKLYPLYQTQTQVNAAWEDSIRIANEARLSLQPVIDLYARLTLGGRDAGLSAERIARLTETAAKAAKLSGGTSISQDAGLYQFAQGIGSGNLGGDELRSVKENTIRLAKAIADGMGVTIAELKKLGKAGKLTAEVIATALEKERVKIDAELAKLPPTISSATAKLGTAFLQMVNGADEASGVTIAFAKGLGFLSSNLGTVTQGIFMLATAYATMRAVNMVGNSIANVAAWRAERVEMQRTAQQALTTSTAQRKASAERVVALRNERTALQSRVAAERTAYQQTLATATAARQAIARGGNALTGAEFRAYRNYINEARVAATNLAATQTALRNNSAALRTGVGSLTTATVGYRAATQQAGAAVGVFASAGRALWSVIGPNLLGAALGVGIGLLIQWAFRESEAARAAKAMSAAQSELARFVDQTTGAIRDQNSALLQNAILQNKKTQAGALEKFTSARERTDASFTTSGVFGYSRDPDVQAVRKIGEDYRTRRIGSAEAARRVGEISKRRPDLAGYTNPILSNASDTVTYARQADQARAASELLAGNNTPENRRRAFGNFTGKDEEGFDNFDPKAKAGGDADKKLGRARKERAKGTDEAAKAERELQKVQERTDKRTDILSRYDEQSSAMDRAAKDARELAQLVGKEINDARFINEKNPLGKGIYTREMATADKARIDYGVRQPLRDVFTEQKRGLEISKMRLEGYDLEADALERALSLQDDLGELSKQDLEDLIKNERQQLRINDALASRQRQVEGILDAANQTRDAFEEMVVGFRKNPLESIKNFGNTLIDNVTRIEARRLTEMLFAGADEKLRDLVTGSNGVERAADILASNVNRASDSTANLATANDNLASSTEYAAARIRAAGDAAAGGVTGLAPGSNLFGSPTGGASLQDAFDATFGQGKAGTIASTFAKVTGSAASALSFFNTGGAAAPSNGDGVANDNVVEGPDLTVTATTPRRQPKQGPVPSGTTAYGKVFEQLGQTLDKTFKSGTFFSGIGKGVGKALGGAATGMMASSVLGMLGVKQSQTGAAIGGAAGSFIPIPGGEIIGGLIGGTLGGMLGKRPRGAAEVTNTSVNGHTNDTGLTTEITGWGKSLQGNIQQIADALGAEVGAYDVGLGRYKDYYQVSRKSGDKALGNSYFNKKSSNAVYDGLDEAEAMAAAIKAALEDGAIKGISAASQKILASGKDLEKAISKAVAIESIPKRLMQKLDPVRYAVQTLNDEFTRLISYLKEGGATAAQFADAQKLYDLERAEAIKQATQQSVAALQAYLDEMRGGASSPFNKRTVYENAAEKLSTFRADIAAGRVVDQSDLLTAAKNYQDASQSLYGSSQAFFADFEELFQLLTKARDNAAGTGSGALPDSPFNNTEMTSYLNQLNTTTQTQTDVLSGQLGTIIGLLQGGGGSGSGGSSALDLLPGLSWLDRVRRDAA